MSAFDELAAEEDKLLEKVLIGLAECEQDMDEAEKDSEIYRINKTQSIYAKRRCLLVQIPKFWYIVLAQNEDFSEYISTDDLKYLEYIKDIYVEWMIDAEGKKSKNPRDFSITFEFESIDEKEIKNQKIVKKFQTVNDSENGEEKLISSPTKIEWPYDYDSINPNKIEDKTSKEGKKNYRAGMRSFFAWFKWTGLKPGKEFRNGEELARLITDDLFPYSVKYYTEAMPGIGDDDDDDSSSEELDLSDDEEIEDQENDIEKNNKKRVLEDKDQIDKALKKKMK
ncbi:hypothetical protein PACTADRAFT_68305 [Pachysolen tannophilus NRRL Y-2460]|uniref:Vacuolar protein sorting-associated protein 75 n=1 Tax=Pachysolen tannophilus NRRL Y-2460 TaxID=669874 RepID=A0A1E4TU10_PACTA|nr:hypothetical protein PACTADRAFT_68305 [Pachysolen tannophilus NRRL Y-2460]